MQTRESPSILQNQTAILGIRMVLPQLPNLNSKLHIEASLVTKGRVTKGILGSNLKPNPLIRENSLVIAGKFLC